MWKRLFIFCVALAADVALLIYGYKTNQFVVFTQIGNRILEVSAPLPCTVPIKYRIDQVDPEFKLSKEEFTKDASAAAQIWNTTKGKQLFVYDPEGELSLNLVYDGRQKLSSQINQMQSDLNSVEKTLTPGEVQFRKDSVDYEQKVKQLNAEIDSWNQKGGAPEETANQLNAQVKDLKAEADRLNADAAKLNKISNSYNAQVGTLNKTVGTFNAQLSQKPEEGIYIGDMNRIEIYFDNGKAELVHTLAHELGHAIGMNHVSDENAILYTSTNLKLKPTKDDIAELDRICSGMTQSQK